MLARWEPEALLSWKHSSGIFMINSETSRESPTLSLICPHGTPFISLCLCPELNLSQPVFWSWASTGRSSAQTSIFSLGGLRNQATHFCTRLRRLEGLECPVSPFLDQPCTRIDWSTNRSEGCQNMWSPSKVSAIDLLHNKKFPPLIIPRKYSHSSRVGLLQNK